MAIKFAPRALSTGLSAKALLSSCGLKSDDPAGSDAGAALTEK